jgi:hypothetical protein
MYVEIQTTRGDTTVKFGGTVEKVEEATEMADKLDLWSLGTAERDYCPDEPEKDAPVTKPEGDGWEILPAGPTRWIRRHYGPKPERFIVFGEGGGRAYREVIVDGRADLSFDKGDVKVTTSDRLFVRA